MAGGAFKRAGSTKIRAGGKISKRLRFGHRGAYRLRLAYGGSRTVVRGTATVELNVP